MMGGNRVNGRCPTCRLDFRRGDARKAEVILGCRRRRRRSPGGEESEGEEEEVEEGEGEEEQQMDVSDVRGSWGTKVSGWWVWVWVHACMHSRPPALTVHGAAENENTGDGAGGGGAAPAARRQVPRLLGVGRGA